MRVGVSLVLIALLFAGCTAELVPVPSQDSGTRESNDLRRNGAAGSRAPRPQMPLDEVGGGTSAAGGGGADEGEADDDAGITTEALDAAVTEVRDAALAPAPSPENSAPVPADPGRPPFEAPIADDCITETAPGDHTFTCSNLTFLMRVDPQCTQAACGLIVDIHGTGMAAAQMRDTTRLHELAPSRGYIVVHPSATPGSTGGTWIEPMYPGVADFVQRTIRAFHVDQARVHITGFSQGADMTFWFLCNHPELVASAAAASRAMPGPDCIGSRWRQRAPILYMHGSEDTLTILSARAMIDDIVTRLSLGDGVAIATELEYSWQRWTVPDMELDYIEHAYTRLLAGGHCVPGGADTPLEGPNNLTVNASTCTIGNIQLDWGELALQWFVDHPRKPAPAAGP